MVRGTLTRGQKLRRKTVLGRDEADSPDIYALRGGPGLPTVVLGE
jgi:hypothetical protein